MNVQEAVENAGYNQYNMPQKFTPIKIDECVYIFGECHGVRLRKRSPENNDYHILVDIICEDDGHWFETNTLGSSHWIPDFEKVLKTLNKYFKVRCEPDGKYGYSFRDFE